MMDAMLKAVFKMAGIPQAAVDDLVRQLPKIMDEGVPQFIDAVKGINENLKLISAKQDEILALLKGTEHEAVIVDATPITLGSVKGRGERSPVASNS